MSFIVDDVEQRVFEKRSLSKKQKRNKKETKGKKEAKRRKKKYMQAIERDMED